MAMFNRHPLMQLLAAGLAGVGASACCAGPLVAVSLGFGGAWLASLTALEPLRPLFIAVTVGLFALAFRRLYLSPVACAPGEQCAVAGVKRRQRLIFWLVLLPVAAVVAFPWYAVWFY
jgi:mercuric ion transport protein